MKLSPGSILWRTLLVMVAALVLSQLAALWLLDEYVTKPRAALGVGQFVSHLKTISAALQTMSPEQQQAFVSRIAEKEGIRIARVRGDERLRPAGDLPPLRMFRERIREIFGPEAEVYVRPEGDRPRARTFFIRLPAGSDDYWVAFPRGRIERDFSTAFIAWSIAGLAIAILATFFLMWRLNSPLGELAMAAEELGKGRDPAPVAERGPTEIRAVARAFNQMKDDLAASQRERATFLAGISHDLRTPLSRLRLDIEMLEGRVDESVQHGMVQDVEDMNAIIDQFIDFMRSESAEPLTSVDLAELARGCAERAARSGASVRCELEAVPPLMLRPLALQRVVDNLVQNAAKHAGGEIVVRTGVTPGHAWLSVLDRGPGIPSEMVEHLKQPFTRRDAARSGSSGAGLGLAIASRVAALHHGRLDLVARDGGGLEAKLTLPVTA
jgi:two-component system osmolarity sensor histidine kinase EnvZ